MRTRHVLPVVLAVTALALAACGPPPESQTATAIAQTAVAETATALASTATPSAPTPTPMAGGGRIIFSSTRDGNFEVYVMAPDGSDVTRLTRRPADDWEPVWSPDGTRIAFESYHSGNLEVFVMNADGTGVTNLTNHPADDFLPAWSPDGTHIAFTSDRDGDWEIYIMAVPVGPGAEAVNLTNNPSADDAAPDWFP